MATKHTYSFLRNFLSGEAHFGFWGVVSKGVGLANTFLVISALSLYQYGVFQLLLSLYAIVSSALSIGGGVVANDIQRFAGEGDEPKAKRLFFEYHGVRVLGGILVSLLLFFGSGIFATKYSPEVIQFVKLLAPLLMLEIVFSVLKSLLILRLRFGLVASRSSIYKFVQLAVILFYFFSSTLSVKEVLFSMILGSLLSSLLMLAPAWHSYRETWKGTAAASPSLLLWVFSHHGKWEVLWQFASKATASFQPWLIKLFVGTEAVAIYTVAQTMITTVIGFFPTNTLKTLVPLEVGNPDRLKRLYHLGSKYLFFLSVIFAVGAAVSGPLFIELFFPKYIPSLIYFYSLLPYIPITALSAVASIFLVVMRMQKYLFYQKILKGLTVVPLLVLLSFSGLWGLVVYQLVFSFLLFVTIYNFLRRVPPHFKIVWRDLFRFGPEDREFVSRVWREITRFFSVKLSRFSS